MPVRGWGGGRYGVGFAAAAPAGATGGAARRCPGAVGDESTAFGQPATEVVITRSKQPLQIPWLIPGVAADVNTSNRLSASSTSAHSPSTFHRLHHPHTETSEVPGRDAGASRGSVRRVMLSKDTRPFDAGRITISMCRRSPGASHLYRNRASRPARTRRSRSRYTCRVSSPDTKSHKDRPSTLSATICSPPLRSAKADHASLTFLSTSSASISYATLGCALPTRPPLPCASSVPYCRTGDRPIPSPSRDQRPDACFPPPPGDLV